MSVCEEIKEHYEAYALGALDVQELELVEAHLASGCLHCAAEVQRARWVVSQLAYLAPDCAPPKNLRKRVLRAAEAAGAGELRSWLPAWAWAAAAVVFLLFVYSVLQVRHLQDETSGLQAELEQERQRQRELLAERQASEQALVILSASGTREVKLKPQDPALPEIRAFWNPGQGLLVAGSNVPAPPETRTFQLWLVPKSGSPISAGLFQPDEAGKVLAVSLLEKQVAEITTLAISEEPAGGLPQPTKDRIRWVGLI